MGEQDDLLFTDYSALVNQNKTKESYRIKSSFNLIIISGSDDSGTLYGCLELADRVKDADHLPDKIDFSDQPEMVLRGTCIGLKKLNICREGRFMNTLILRKIFHGFMINNNGLITLTCWWKIE